MVPAPNLHKICRLCFCLAGLTSLTVVADKPLLNAESPVMQVARYSVLHPIPLLGQEELLSVPVARDVPKEVVTVGGALAWLINGSGYRLVASDQLSLKAQAFLNLPLPEVHRHFQALPLKAVIDLLIGPAFRWVHDPVLRLISVERCSQRVQLSNRAKTENIESTTEGDL